MSILSEFAPCGRSIVGHTFIEPGRYIGATLREACRQPFVRLHSIEVHEPHVRAGRDAFAEDARVAIHLGSSPAIIPAVADPALPTTFYLDAHYQGGPREEQDMSAGECPLLSELEAIAAIPWQSKPIIVIDDCHMLLRPWDERLLVTFDLGQWPIMEDVLAMLEGYEPISGPDDIVYFFPGSP